MYNEVLCKEYVRCYAVEMYDIGFLATDIPLRTLSSIMGVELFVLFYYYINCSRA